MRTMCISMFCSSFGGAQPSLASSWVSLSEVQLLHPTACNITQHKLQPTTSMAKVLSSLWRYHSMQMMRQAVRAQRLQALRIGLVLLSVSDCCQTTNNCCVPHSPSRYGSCRHHVEVLDEKPAAERGSARERGSHERTNEWGSPSRQQPKYALVLAWQGAAPTYACSDGTMHVTCGWIICTTTQKKAACRPSLPHPLSCIDHMMQGTCTASKAVAPSTSNHSKAPNHCFAGNGFSPCTCNKTADSSTHFRDLGNHRSPHPPPTNHCRAVSYMQLSALHGFHSARCPAAHTRTQQGPNQACTARPPTLQETQPPGLTADGSAGMERNIPSRATPSCARNPAHLGLCCCLT